MSLEKEQLEKEQKDLIETQEFEQVEDKESKEVIDNTKQLVAGVVTLMVIALLIIATLFNRSVDTAALDWVSDHEKIEELKKILIDGVSIEDTYESVRVYNWSYAQDGEDEFLKVETEDGVDIYNTTDEELEESYDLDEMKANFIGSIGKYESEGAELEVLIDEDYNVTLEMCFVESDEEELDEEELDEEELDEEELDEEELDEEELDEEELDEEELDEEELDEEELDEEELDEEELDEEELDEEELDEEELDEEELDEEELDEEELDEEELDEEELDEEELDEEEFKIIEYIQVLVMSGEIVAETMVEVRVGYDLVIFEWLNAETIMVNPVEGFSQEQLEAFPELCEALTDKVYKLVPEVEGEDLEDEEEELELFNNGYEVEIVQNLGSKILFTLTKDDEPLLIEVKAHKVREDNDFAIYQDDEYTIYFKEYSQEQLLVTIYDGELNIVLQWVVDF